MLKLDLEDVNIRKKKPDIGIGAELVVVEYKKSKAYKDNDLKTFYRECSVLRSTMLKHLIEKSPLRRQVVRCAESLNPNMMVDADEKESCAVKFRYLCTKLAHIGQISASSANKATDEYRKFLRSVLPRYQLEFTEFDKYKDSVRI